MQDLSCTPCRQKPLPSLPGNSFSKKTNPPHNLKPPSPPQTQRRRLSPASSWAEGQRAGKRGGERGARTQRDGGDGPGSCPSRPGAERGPSAKRPQPCAARGAPRGTAEPPYPTALNTGRYGKYTIRKDSTGKIKKMLAHYLLLRENTIEVGWNLARGDRFLFTACQ